MQIYKILSSDKLSEYTFIVSDAPVRNYRLIDNDDEDIFYAEDDENNIKFKKNLGKEFNYADVSDLKLFLDLINQFDKNLFVNYEVFELIATL